jgi:hypothetical protein
LLRSLQNESGSRHIGNARTHQLAIHHFVVSAPARYRTAHHVAQFVELIPVDDSLVNCAGYISAFQGRLFQGINEPAICYCQQLVIYLSVPRAGRAGADHGSAA